MKKKNLIWIVPIIVILVITISFFVFRPQQETAYFYSEDLGIVKTTITHHSWFSRLFIPFQQAVVFTPDEITLGDSATVKDDYDIPIFGVLGSSIGYYEYINYYNIKISSTTGVYKEILTSGWYSRPYGPNEHIWATTTYTPPRAGTYLAVTEYGIIQCENPATPFNVEPSMCYSMISGCTFESDCLIEDYSVNTLEVIDSTSPPPQCTKTDRWTNWVVDSSTTVSNGEVYKRTFEKVDSSCDYYIDRTEYRVVCNDNYGVDGTSSPTADGKAHTCDLINVVSSDICSIDDDCILPEKCNPITKGCAISNCDAAITQNCSDGTIVVVKECTNGFQVDPVSKQECPIISGEDISDEIVDSEDDEVADDEAADDKDGEEEEFNYILASIIGGMLLIFIVGVIVVSRQRRPARPVRTY